MDLPAILSRVAANETTLTDYNNLRTLLTIPGKQTAVMKAYFTLASNPEKCREYLPVALRRNLASELTKDLSK